MRVSKDFFDSFTSPPFLSETVRGCGVLLLDLLVPARSDKDSRASQLCAVVEERLLSQRYLPTWADVTAVAWLSLN